MQTEGIEGVAPSNNFTVGRVRKDLQNRSNIGAIFVNRQASGRLAGVDDYNRTFGVDGRWGIGQNHDDIRVCRQNRDTRPGRRRARLQPELRVQLTGVAAQLQLHGSW